MFRKLFPLFLVTLALVVFSGVWFYTNLKPASTTKNFQNFLITKGSGAAQIGNKLKEYGFIRSPLAFKIYVQVTGLQSRIQAGEYSLSPSLSLVKIVTELVKGPTEVWVTIPEGLRREEVAEKFISGLGLKGEVAIEFRSGFLNQTVSREGYLFPDTYLFARTVTPEAVIARMLAIFEKKAGTVSKEDLIIASLLERETITEGEKPIVAGIMKNRIDAGWPLQVDAAVQYAVANGKCKGKVCDDWWPELTKDDIAINSPYNTYRFPGLPPSPIASPGLSSIKAAQNPKDSDYWYYIHDIKGVIHFARTLEEHNENIRKYLGK